VPLILKANLSGAYHSSEVSGVDEGGQCADLYTCGPHVDDEGGLYECGRVDEDDAVVCILSLLFC
jgi:hypothetical protein